MKRMLSLATVAFLITAAAWAQDPYAHIDASFWQQFDVLANYFSGIPQNGGLVFPSIADQWAQRVGGNPDFSNFHENLAQVLAVPDTNAALLQQDMDVFGLRPIGQNSTQAQADLVAADLAASLNIPLAEATAIIDQVRQDLADGQYTEAEAQANLDALVQAAGVALGQVLTEVQRAVAAHIGMAGFAPHSGPVTLGRNTVRGRLATLHPFHHSIRGGIDTWVQRGEWDNDTLHDEDKDTIGMVPYIESEEDGLLWSVGCPLLFTDLVHIEEDESWAGGVEGMVQKTFEDGLFVGLRGAGLIHYAEGLPDNDFLSLSAGPFVGKSVELAEGIVATGMGLLEGLLTEYEDDTAYFMGGLGLSYMPTEKLALHAFGLYCNNLNPYGDEDQEFFDVGGRVELGVGENAALGVSVSTILDSQDVSAVTVSLSWSRQF